MKGTRAVRCRAWLATQPPQRRSNDVRNFLGIGRLSFFVGSGGRHAHRTPACQWCSAKSPWVSLGPQPPCKSLVRTRER